MWSLLLRWCVIRNSRLLPQVLCQTLILWFSHSRAGRNPDSALNSRLRGNDKKTLFLVMTKNQPLMSVCNVFILSPEQELVRIEQNPGNVFIGRSKILTSTAAFDEQLLFFCRRRPGQSGPVNVLDIIVRFLRARKGFSDSIVRMLHEPCYCLSGNHFHCLSQC